MNEETKRQGGTGFGIASLVLGIISLVLFCTCVNIPLAIAAIVFGIIQLVRGNGKGLAVGGLITSVLSIVAFFVFYLVIGINMPKFSDMSDMDAYMQEYMELLEEYEDEYPELEEDDTL